MPDIICVDCGAVLTGARQRRRCDNCRRVHNAYRLVRTLAPGEKVPEGIPGRYLRSHGYVLLRWRVGVRQYVETYEHRVFDGYVTTEDHVHHANHVRSDNRPENLRPLAADEHYVIHGDPAWWVRAARLYGTGHSTYEVGKRLSRNAATVYRALVKMGVPLRKEARIAIPRRESNPA